MELTFRKADSAAKPCRAAGLTFFLTILRDFLPLCLLPLPFQECLCDTAINEIPWQDLVQRPLSVGIEIRAQPAFLQRLQPSLIVDRKSVV